MPCEDGLIGLINKDGKGGMSCFQEICIFHMKVYIADLVPSIQQFSVMELIVHILSLLRNMTVWCVLHSFFGLWRDMTIYFSILVHSIA